MWRAVLGVVAVVLVLVGWRWKDIQQAQSPVLAVNATSAVIEEDIIGQPGGMWRIEQHYYDDGDVDCSVIADRERDETVTVLVYRNGGNNTKAHATPVKQTVTRMRNVGWSVAERENDATAALNLLKVRAGLCLGYIPTDCSMYDGLVELRRPLWHHQREVDENCQAETLGNFSDESCLVSYLSYAREMDLYTRTARRVTNLEHLQDDELLYLVPPRNHFFWPGQYVGHRVHMHNLYVDKDTKKVPMIMETLSLEPRVFLIERFVSNTEANVITTQSQDRMVRSEGFESGAYSKGAYRTSQQAWLECADDKLVCELEERVSNATRVPVEHVRNHCDPLQVIRYYKKQHYHSHTDWFDPTTHPQAPGYKEGYNRMYTLLFYLSKVEAGGETVFPLANNLPQDGPPYKLGEGNSTDCTRGLVVRPRQGAALLWYNSLVEGNIVENFVDPLTLHGGCDVIEGTKWAANKWVYTRKWGNRLDVDTHRPGQHLSLRAENMPPPPTYPEFEDPQVAEYVAEGKVSMGFYNARLKTVNVFWVNTEDQSEVFQYELPSEERNQIQTWPTHEFVAREVGSNDIVFRVTVPSGDDYKPKVDYIVE